MAQVGYVRVRSAEENLDVQREKLADCHKIFEEIQDGPSDIRPGLKACLAYLRAGDTLVVTCLDRLARSTLHLCQVAAELERKQAHLRVLEQNVDTRDETGHVFFHMLTIIKQFETELRAKRQMEGIRKAQARGVKLGVPLKLSAEQVAELRQRRQDGVFIKTLMQDYGLSKSSVYRYLARSDNDRIPPGRPGNCAK